MNMLGLFSIFFLLFSTTASSSSPLQIGWEKHFKDSIEFAERVHTVYDSTSGDLFFLTENGYFTKVDPKTGKEICRYVFTSSDDHNIQEPIYYSPLLYFGNSKGYCSINSKDCSVLLSVKKNSNESPAICSSPKSGVFLKDLLIIGGKQKRNGCIQGVEPKNGRINWSVTFEDEIIVSKPVSNEQLSFFLTSAQLLAIDYQGKIKWKYRVGSLSESSYPILYQNSIVFAEPKCIYRVDGITGREIWKKADLQSDDFTTPLVYREKIYIQDGSSTIACLDVKNGNRKWKTKIQDSYSVSTAQLRVYNNCIVGIAAGFNNTNFIFFLNPESGNLENTLELPSNEIFADPITVMGDEILTKSNRRMEDNADYSYQIVRLFKLKPGK